jgi:hypothetical protein
VRPHQSHRPIAWFIIDVVEKVEAGFNGRMLPPPKKSRGAGTLRPRKRETQSFSRCFLYLPTVPFLRIPSFHFAIRPVFREPQSNQECARTDSAAGYSHRPTCKPPSATESLASLPPRQWKARRSMPPHRIIARSRHHLWALEDKEEREASSQTLEVANLQ